MPSIKEQFDEYTDRMAEIRRLSSPDINVFDDEDDYSKKLRYNFQRIGRLAALNRDMLDKTLYPLLEKSKELDEQTTKQLGELAENLASIANQDNDFVNLDLPVSALISDRLSSDALKKKDLYTQIKQLDDEINVDYALMNVTERINVSPEISRTYQKKGLLIGDFFFKLLDKKKFAEIDDDLCRKIILTNARFTSVFFEGNTDSKLNKKNLDILNLMMEIYNDDFYHQAVSGYNWDYFLYRTYEYYLQCTDICNSRGFSRKQLDLIGDKAEEMERLIRDNPKPYVDVVGFSFIPVAIARCRYLCGRLSKDEYEDYLVNAYESRDKLCFRTEGGYFNILLPLEYLCIIDRDNMNAQVVSRLEGIYGDIIDYIFKMPGDGSKCFLMEYLAEYINRFIEIPSVYTIKDFVIQCMAAIHPPTYIHSVMVGQISECICRHLLSKMPGVFIGFPGCSNVDDVKANKAAILDYTYNAALCHDFGKIYIMDTIFVYGRKLMDFEFDIIKSHPQMGYDLLSKFESTKKYAPVAKGHHKWYDDSFGYPSDFTTSDSPYKVIIDIVQCADCMDAATDTIGRSYSQGKNLEVILKEIKRDCGKRYAPFFGKLFDMYEVRWDLEYLLSEQRGKNYRKTFSLLKSVMRKA